MWFEDVILFDDPNLPPLYPNERQTQPQISSKHSQFEPKQTPGIMGIFYEVKKDGSQATSARNPLRE